jgi:hypothetical protein
VTSVSPVKAKQCFAPSSRSKGKTSN